MVLKTQDSNNALFVQAKIRKASVLADDGSYFLANNNQTAVNRNIGTSYSALLAQLVIVNSGSGIIWLDYICVNTVTATTAASGATVTNYAVVIDNINRYTSGGTQLTPFSPNMALGNPSTATAVATVYAGPIVAPAAGSPRAVIGERIFRPAASGTALSVVGDMVFINFGGVEGAEAGNIVVANPCIIPHSAPPVGIGAGHSALLYLWNTATTPAAGTDIYEVGFYTKGGPVP